MLKGWKYLGYSVHVVYINDTYYKAYHVWFGPWSIQWHTEVN